MTEDSILNIDIITASKEGKPELVRKLIKAGSNVNDRDTGGYTALHWACQRHFVEIVLILIERGADVNTKSTERTECQTPLHLACIFQNPQIVRLLLEAGADASARNQERWTPLDYLRQKPVTNPAREEILDLFREHAPEMVMERYCSPGPGT
ncbi:MAG: ankyrin repeat domain-containing protein [Syntrophorhabdus sp.]|nr:ankyrin repeat domain-containing protein [Syntrophorhabdus sp.]